MSSFWSQAVPAFVGGAVGGSGGILVITATHWYDSIKERKSFRRGRIAEWRDGLTRWEVPLYAKKSLLPDQRLILYRAIVRLEWYRSLRPRLSPGVADEVEDRVRNWSGEMQPTERDPVAALLDEEVARIEHEWRLA